MGKLNAKKLAPTHLDIQRDEIRVVAVKQRKGSRQRYFWGAFLSLLWRLMRYRNAKDYSHQIAGRMMREFCEDLGVLWIKLGQLFSMRTDILPMEICDELAALRDRTNGFPGKLALATLEQELGKPLSQVFKYVEEHPFAAASTAQVHRGQLLDGTDVAIKIQRPDLLQVVAEDMAMSHRMIRFFKAMNIASNMDWDSFLAEFQGIINEEIDYRYEASHMRRMRKTLRRHKIHVPKLFARLSSTKVIVMEYVHGVLMSDYLSQMQSAPEQVAKWDSVNNVDPKRIGKRLLMSLNRQIFEDNLFHGDLHPGNIILLRNSRLAFIDFGSTGSLEVGFLRKYEAVVEAMGQRNYSKATDLFLLLQAALPPTNMVDLKAEMIAALRAWESRCDRKDLDYDDRSFAQLSEQMTKIAQKYDIPALWEFLRIGRSTATLDGSLRHLYPDANYNKLMKCYIKARARRAARKFANRAPVFNQGPSIEETLAAQIIMNEKAESQAHLTRQAAKNYSVSSGKAVQFFIGPLVKSLSYAVSLSGIYLVLVFINQHHHYVVSGLWEMAWFNDAYHVLNLFPNMTYQLWIITLIGFFSVSRVFSRLRREFIECDNRAIE